ncbi:MAG: hypothetical protein CL758_02785 [Chloroflexi bacterium]|nr:hypothetical protein [Chloroflexota bacterium]|tara:strand:+ start:11069 stop:15562 length:4494 start_codon:yes stop_codon:yes gene_type:complete
MFILDKKPYINNLLKFIPIILILLVGLSFRLYGINWDEGFTYTPHPDERAIISKVNQIELPPTSLNGIKELLNPLISSWNPRWFPYGSFPLYLLKSVQIIYNNIFDNNLYDLRITGRLISSISDTITIGLIYLIGRKLYSNKVGLLSSSLLAISVLHIQLSHFYTVDTILTLFSTLSVYLILCNTQHISKKYSALIGIATAVAIATKISLIPIVGIYFFGHLFFICGILQNFTIKEFKFYFKNRLWISLKSINLTIIIFIITLLFIQPYMFLDWRNFYQDISEQSQMVRRFVDYPYTRQYINTTAFMYQIKQVSIWGLGIPLGTISFLGLIYFYFEGLSKKNCIIFVIAGWIIPIILLLYSTHSIVLILASLTGLISLLFTIPFRTHNSLKNVILLSWVIPIFLITGSFQVKFLRYFLPITPFIILFGSKLMLDIVEIKSKYITKKQFKLISYSLISIIILITFIYAFSFVNIYSKPHTAVTSSQWINHNVPKNSLILKEHWEENLPNIENYRILELPLYDTDSINKVNLISNRLSEADYLIIYSNRLYGTINKLPERYPYSTAYYQLLFDEKIGYEFVNLETNSPNIFNLHFQHNIFENLNINIPEIYKLTYQENKYNFTLGNPDESFSVYDHPSVFILKNTKTLSHTQIKDLIISKSMENSLKNNIANEENLLIEEQEFIKRTNNGTWSDIIKISSWTNTYPVIAWLLILQAFFVITLPISLIIFNNLPDKGYSISKTLSLLIISLIVWWLTSTKLIMFTKLSVFISIGILSLFSVYITIKNYNAFHQFIKSKWKILLTSEIIFLIAFIGFLIIRMSNPDLWHPWRGGEKPMDLAYLNAILHSSYMPPIDPWYSEGYINYYYYGHFITSTLIMGTGIIPTTAYNLAIPLFFALVFSTSFSIIYNLCSISLNNNKHINKSTNNISHTRKIYTSPIIFGLICASFVSILGNLEGGIQLVNILSNQITNGFDYWSSSRIMSSDTYGITEFPYFTFLFADLHAHLMSLPFTILVLFTSISIISNPKKDNNLNLFFSYKTKLLKLTLLGISIGSLRLLNAWDFPTYLIIGCISILIAEYYWHGGLSLVVFVKSISLSIYVFIIGYLAFIPFHLTYQTFFNSIEKTPYTTEFWRLFVIFGLFIFIITTFYLQNSIPILKNIYYRIKNKFSTIYKDLAEGTETTIVSKNIKLIIILFSFTFIGFIITFILTKGISSTVIFTSFILILAFLTLSKYSNYTPQTNFLLTINVIALFLIIGLEFFRIEGDIDRMNSIFKFYLQVWIIFSISSTYFLWLTIKNTHIVNKKFILWIISLILLILISSIYTLMGTKARIDDRFAGNSQNLTLNGSEYTDYAIYNDPNGTKINLKLDFEGIEWMQNSIQGTPIILEAHTPSYRWGSRVSVYTGLPTVIGWKWHQEQQRWNYREDIEERIKDVETIYNSNDIEKTISLIEKYKINYIYVGKVEKIYYLNTGLEKFDQMMDLSLVFKNSEVKIYKTHLNNN